MSAVMRCAGLLTIVLGVGILRSLGPVPGLSPGLSHPLGLALLLLFVIWIAARSEGRRLAALPLVAALMLEGWVRLTLINPAFERWLAPRLSERQADSVYHLMGAAWLVGIVLLFASACRVSLGSRLLPGCWRRGLYLHTLSVLFVYGTLSALLQAAGGFRGLELQVPIYPRVALWMLAGQAALCLGEEVFYRGFVAGAVAMALSGPRGEASQRTSVALAGWLSSALFALDHLRGMSWGLPLAMTGLYTLGLGLLLFYLTRLTGNLALATLAHLFHNLMILRLGLAVSDPGGALAFGSEIYISLYFILTFTLLFLIRRPSWAPLRRTLADAT